MKLRLLSLWFLKLFGKSRPHPIGHGRALSLSRSLNQGLKPRRLKGDDMLGISFSLNWLFHEILSKSLGRGLAIYGHIYLPRQTPRRLGRGTQSLKPGFSTVRYQIQIAAPNSSAS